MFASMGIGSSANPHVFVLECIMPTSYFKILPVVYQKAVMVAVLPVVFMLLCGIAWFVHDHLCQPKVRPMAHTPIPSALYQKHKKHNADKAKAAAMKDELKRMQEEAGIEDDAFSHAAGSLDNDSVEDFGYIFRRAIEDAQRAHIDTDESFAYFENLGGANENAPGESKAGSDGEEPSMSTAAFEHMLSEWGVKGLADERLMWSMLERVDSDGSGWIGASELRQFIRSTTDKWILSSTVVAYMFYPTCCKAAFMLISCRGDLKDGAHEYYLTDDLDQPCWGPSHVAIITSIAIPFLVIWVVGLPVAMYVVLKLHQKEKHNDQMRFRFGMLMEGYE